MDRSGNPTLKNKAFQTQVSGNVQPMTMAGVSLKTFFLLVLVFAGAAFGWSQTSHLSSSFWIILIIASSVGLALAIFTAFKPKVAVVTGPIYALTQGYVMGVISYGMNLLFPGIVIQAILLTMAIFLVTLAVYATGIIKVSKKFVLGVIIATAGIALYYVAYLIFSLFGIQLPLVDSNSPWGIAFSVLIVILATLNLILDFDFIKKSVEAKTPKYLEWYSGFSLIVTLLWLYVEVLRLLSKIRR